MAKQYRIHIRGKQRDVIDIDLMAHLVIALGRQLAREAEDADKAEAPAAEGEATGTSRGTGAAAC